MEIVGAERRQELEYTYACMYVCMDGWIERDQGREGWREMVERKEGGQARECDRNERLIYLTLCTKAEKLCNGLHSVHCMLGKTR